MARHKLYGFDLVRVLTARTTLRGRCHLLVSWIPCGWLCVDCWPGFWEFFSHTVPTNCRWLKIQWKNFWWWQILTVNADEDALIKKYSFNSNYPKPSYSSSRASHESLSHESVFKDTSWGLNSTKEWVIERNLQREVFCCLISHLAPSQSSNPANSNYVIPSPDSLW